MRRAPLICFLVPAALAAALLGCGDDDDEPGPTRRAAPAVSETDSPPPIYDAHGALVPSGEIVFGVELPRGLELAREEERTRVYRTDVPLAKVQAYFGPRLPTPDVERIGTGVVFRNAPVRSPTGQSLHVTVSVLPVVGGTRVELRHQALPAAQPMTESDYLEALKRDSARWD